MVISIYWDEDIVAHLDPERRAKVEKQRTQDLLLVCVHTVADNARDHGRYFSFKGLVLRMLSGPIYKGSFVRMGVFTTVDDYFLGAIASRLLYFPMKDNSDMRDRRGDEDDEPLGDEDIDRAVDFLSETVIDLDDARLAGLVHTVTIV